MPISPDASPLRLLIAGIAGRVVLIGQTADALVHFDGRRFVVPQGSDPAALAPELMLQAALLAIDSFDRPTLRRLAHRPRAARRYRVLESWRARVALRNVLPRGLIERPELAASVRVAMARSESLERALGDEVLPDPPPLFGCLRPLLVLRQSGDDLTQHEEAEVIGRGTAGDDGERGGEESDAADGGGFLKAITNPGSKGGPVTDLMKLLLGLGGKAARGAPSAGIGGVKGLIARRSDHRPEQGFALAARGPADARGDVGVGAIPGVYRYPEWDGARGRYRAGGVCVVETAPWPSDRRPEIGRVLQPGSRRLRDGLARIGLDHEPRRRQSTGDDLVLDALVALVVEARSGHAADERIYRRTLRTRRDLGVLILVDTSGSTGAQEDGAEVHAMQLRAAFRLAEALERLGDRVALAGFQSWGRERTFFLSAKDFNGRLDATARGRILDLEPAGFTRMGAAIRHATHILATRSGMPHRLLILVSDGIPYDRDGYESTIADADVARAIAEARERDCACLCLCVGASAESGRVRRSFGWDQVVVIDTPDELDAAISPAVRRALSACRRRGQIA